MASEKTPEVQPPKIGPDGLDRELSAAYAEAGIRPVSEHVKDWGMASPTPEQWVRHHQTLMQNAIIYGRAFNGPTRQAASAFSFSPSYASGPGGGGAQAFGTLRYSVAPLEDAGIRAGEVRAWRCWRVEGGRLRSVSADDIWEPGVPMTVQFGNVSDHGSVGVHAWKTREQALAYGLGDVVGQIDLWGEIVEHELGYRAEFGSVVSLDYGRKSLLRKLRKTYGVGGEDRINWRWWFRRVINPSIIGVSSGYLLGQFAVSPFMRWMGWI